ncbi:hypothetical protein B0H10DRAFT_2234643 [Mycena sp. CBHHK59/15]|nr:hypothetical protein B0H10DRAFT_2234643 [Mycena sp. CBHHK59/15]
MAYNSHREPEFTSESTLNEPASADQYTGAFFPGAQSFVIADGKFKTVTNINYPAPTASPDFRNILLGDLDLFSEIRLDRGTYLVNHHRGSRRIYPSKVYGIKSNKTVAIYQGKNAEEEWKRDISRYSRFRHHNLVQLFGIVNAECGLHAAVFNDELIPAQHVLEKHGASRLSTVYLLVRLAEELEDAQQFIDSLSETFMPLLDITEDENEIILMVGSSPFPRKDGYITDAIAAEYWLSQANCIFSRLDITSGYDDYVGDIPAGYLFLRPLADFESDTGRFRLPDCEGDAYWSLDPSGVERLSMEEATNLGFPFMDFDMEIYGFSWDASAYAGLRQFHLGKGFDPESQDVARHLSLPLYQVIDRDGVEAPLTHVPGIDSTAESEAPEVLQRHEDHENEIQRSGPSLALVEKGFCPLEDMELPLSWKIVLSVQFTLILILALLGLYEYFRGRYLT